MTAATSGAYVKYSAGSVLLVQYCAIFKFLQSTPSWTFKAQSNTPFTRRPPI